MNKKNDELIITDIEMFISLTIAIVLISSAIISYNNHLKLSGEKPFLTDYQIRKIVLISKIIIFILALISFIIAIKNLNDLKAENKNLDNAYLIVSAAFLFLLSTVLLLIVAFKNESSFQMGIDEFVL